MTNIVTPILQEKYIFLSFQVLPLLVAGWVAFRPSMADRPRWLAKVLLAVGALQLATIAFYYIRWAIDLNVDEVSRKLLPPYSTFYLSHLQTEVTALAVSWLVTLLVWWGGRWWFLQRTKGRMLDGLDVMLLVIGVAAIGWPGLFLYGAALFIVSVLAMVALVIIGQKRMTDRLIVTPYIIPVAVIMLFLRAWLLGGTGLWRIGF